MKLKVCCVYDRAVESYAQPMFVQHIGQAVRSFGDEVKRVHSEGNPSPLNQHPEDYLLYELGTFDNDTGLLEGQLPRIIASGVDYKG